VSGLNREQLRVASDPGASLPADTTVPLDVSVVLCTYTEQRWQLLTAAVGSLQRQTAPPHEVIVVTDYNDVLLERVRASLPGAIAMPNSRERGAAGARNTGAAAASGSVVAFLDDDAVAASDWIERMLEAFSDQSILGVGGEIVPEYEAPRPRWLPREFDWVLGCTYRGLPEVTCPIRNLIGANMAVRKDVFLALDGFRPGHGNVQDDGGQPLRRRRFVTRQSGCEETDLCVRALRRWPGSVWLYHPPVLVHHRVPAARLTWRYFLARCNDEGLAKAEVVVDYSGAELGLASERSYVAKTLTSGVRTGLADFLRGDVYGLARAGAITAGLLVTVQAYARGRLAPTDRHRPPR
jgi:glycosyltransferase involved in cell wall biosynthesis